MKSKEQQLLEEAYGKVLNNKPSFTPIEAKYIYFPDVKELYRIDPYQLIQDTNKEMKSIPKEGWTEVRVVDGETIVELGLAPKFDHEENGPLSNPSGIDTGSWYEVSKDNPKLWEQSQRALILKA